MRKSLIRIFFSTAAFVFLCVPAKAAADYDPCLPGNLVICNTQIAMPANPVGYKAIMVVPAPYVHDKFTVECVGSTNGSFGYSITESASVTCKLATCLAESVTVCGYDIPTPGGTEVGKTEKLTIPSGFLSPSAVSRHPTITATCTDTADKTVYTVKERSGSACNDFACPAADLAICDTTVHIEGPGEMGTVKDYTVPPPYPPDHFKVQCLAQNDKPPAYEIVEQKNVTCGKPQ